MSFGWTKKYNHCTWKEFFDLCEADKNRFNEDDKILYFKIVTKTKKATHEHRSILLSEQEINDEKI